MPDQPMMPRGDGPSTDPLAHTLWTLETAEKQGSMATDAVRIAGARPATLHINRAVALSDPDRQMLYGIISNNIAPQHERRSVWRSLQSPIFGGASQRNVRATSVQIKGVVFDCTMPFDTYSGIGYRMECYFADSAGQMRRYHMSKDAIGTCSVTEELREFNNLIEIARRLEHTDVHVPIPVAWGTFDDLEYNGEPLGFGIFGLPDLVEPRDRYYYEALTALTERNDFGPMRDALRQRSRALATLHRVGVTAIFRHFGNMSLTPGGEVLMHDLGSLRVSTREEHLDDEQFIAEALCNLTSALTPADIVIPGAHRYDEAYNAVRNHLAQYTRATLEGYFGVGHPLAESSFEEIEATFLAAFERPLSSLAHPFAQEYRRFVRAWFAR